MPTFLKDVATKPRSPTLQVLMPTFLFPTPISRHDARLSSTTHCALRASRINYNVTNLSRCNSFLHYFSSMDLCSSLPSSPFLFQFFQMLSSDSPGTLSLSLPKSPSFLVTLQALSLFLAKVTKTLTQQNHKSHMQRNSAVSTYFSHAYHYCQEPYRLYLPNLSHSNGSQVLQPCNDLWYLPKICSRISQICLCISVSNSLR